MSKVFFVNSESEAVEGALKVAKKYAYMRDGYTDHEIIAMNRSFHGRSLGALSVTGNKHYREPFEPLLDGVKFADFNNLNSVKEKISDKTCAIIIEIIQGEGGIHVANEAFLLGVRELCDKKKIILIIDEIQTGMGRTGKYFAWQNYGIKPDIMTCAKALGGGIPGGAFLVNEKVAKSSLKPGDHGTTFGRSPLVCAAMSKMFDIFENDNILDHVQQITPYFENKLDRLVFDYTCVSMRREKGLLQGLVVETTVPIEKLVLEALKRGLLVNTAGDNVLRFLPPLIITRKHIDEMYEIMKEVLSDFSK